MPACEKVTVVVTLASLSRVFKVANNSVSSSEFVQLKSEIFPVKAMVNSTLSPSAIIICGF